MNIVERLSQIGFATRRELVGIGYACRVFFALLRVAPASFRRFGLIRDQIYFLGNHSLAIITVSGLFVGFVLGLQGYYTLQRYGVFRGPRLGRDAQPGAGVGACCRGPAVRWASRNSPHSRNWLDACR